MNNYAEANISAEQSSSREDHGFRARMATRTSSGFKRRRAKGAARHSVPLLIRRRRNGNAYLRSSSDFAPSTTAASAFTGR